MINNHVIVNIKQLLVRLLNSNPIYKNVYVMMTGKILIIIIHRTTSS